jgi:hypothetical protein
MTAAEQVLALVVLVLVTGCVVPLARPGPPGAAGLAWAAATFLVVLAWFLHKAPYEGPAIIEITSTRGLTVVDMVVPPGLAVALAVGLRWWRARD